MKEWSLQAVDLCCVGFRKKRTRRGAKEKGAEQPAMVFQGVLDFFLICPHVLIQSMCSQRQGAAIPRDGLLGKSECSSEVHFLVVNGK